ncbi:MAG: SoxR reducing system RseC family protein [Bacteroidota bacterium]
MNWIKLGLGVVASLGGAFSGGFIGVLIGLPAAEGQMLASGAIVLGYFIMGALIGLFLCAFLAYRWRTRQVGWLALGAVLLAVGMWFVVRWNAERRKAERATPPPAESQLLDTVREVRQTISPAEVDLAQASPPVTNSDPGYGFVSLPFAREGLRLFFYTDGEDTQTPPVDSLVYGPLGQEPELRYAPPYLQPFYQKMDWPLMLFRLRGVSRFRYQIAVNEGQRQTAWVDKTAVEAQFWPEFLTGVFSVHALEAEVNPVRIKANPLSEPVAGLPGDAILQPVAVAGDWVQVRQLEGELTGWLRWRDARGDILVGWDYIS